MIVTVGNTKGGVGKTTLAFQLALARALTGRDVLLLDGDRQGSGQTAVAIRAEAISSPPWRRPSAAAGPLPAPEGLASRSKSWPRATRRRARNFPRLPS